LAVKLSDTIAKSEPVPADGKPYRIVYDTEVKGFGLRVTKNSARSFVLNYRVRGVERRYTIGSYPDWKVAAAREEAARLKRLIDVGRDPMGERHEERAAATVDELTDRYLEEHAARKRPGSRREDEGLIGQWIRPQLGRRKVADVRLADIESLHRKITRFRSECSDYRAQQLDRKRAQRGTPYRANRVLALLSKMFSLSVRWEMRPDNPVRGVERNPEQKRSRYLKPDELQRLTEVLANHPKREAVNVIRLLLLTGARRGEVLGMRWDQIDFEDGTWTKPSSLTKQKSEHRVPLSAPARQLLSEVRIEADRGEEVTEALLREAENERTPKRAAAKRKAAAFALARKNSAFVFPGRKSGAPLVNVRRVWEDVCERAKLSGIRVHDLRHSYASLLASSGLSLPIIGALLGHTQASTTQRYAHLLDDPLRTATERVGAVIVGGGKSPAEVVEIGRR
jgi:integrase